MHTPVPPTDTPPVEGPQQGRWTYADWDRLPDDGNRYEIIDGVLYLSTAPGYFHQHILLQLVRYVGIPARDQNLAFPIFAPIGVSMPGCEPVQPDFVVVLAARAEIIRDRRIFGVPDLIVEVLAPSNRAYDLETKLAAYALTGLPEYGIIDPQVRTLSHYRLVEQGTFAEPAVYEEADTMHFDCLPSLPLPVGDLFAGSPDTTL